VTVPPNTTAAVCVPASRGSTVTEGNTPAEKADGVERLSTQDDTAVYKIGSGSYRFTSRGFRGPQRR
jgi:alpha-L-rhamnosidase